MEWLRTWKLESWINQTRWTNTLQELIVAWWFILTIFRLSAMITNTQYWLFYPSLTLTSRGLFSTFCNPVFQIGCHVISGLNHFAEAETWRYVAFCLVLDVLPMINIVFATLDCCMTTFTTKIAEDICTRFKLECCTHQIKLIVVMQDEHQVGSHMGFWLR